MSDERVEEIRRKWTGDNAWWKSLDGSWEDDVRDLLTALDQAEREREEARTEAKSAGIELVHWQRYVNSVPATHCVYCGHRNGPGETTPVSMADALKAHVEMSKLKAALARVRAALDRKHLCVMEACCNDAVRAALEGRG